MVEEKGLTCVGCTEKKDFFQLAFDSQAMPMPMPVEEEEAPEGKGKEDIDDIMEKVRASG